MNIFNIEFVPLSITLKDRLEALAAGTWYALFPGGIIFGILSAIYVLFFTRYWYLMCAYLFWIWVVDKDICEKGGRRSNWVYSWSLFKYVKNYFPITAKVHPDLKLDPHRNYLTCAFPHGYLPLAMTTVIQTHLFDEIRKTFRNHVIYGTSLNTLFSLPVSRDYFLALGLVGASAKSLNWILSHPSGGNVAGLLVGGVEEAFYCQDGIYHLILKRRKGFVKIALQNGSPLIPTFVFGQNSNFRQKVFQEGTIGRSVQNYIKRLTGFAFPLLYGRGLFQYNIGIIPLQKPMTIVFGAAIEVEKKENPTAEEIDHLHQKFIDKLVELFEEYKYECEENPEDCVLIVA